MKMERKIAIKNFNYQDFKISSYKYGLWQNYQFIEKCS